MKKSFLLLLSFFIIIQKTFGQTLIPKIDKRVEMLSIVSRLADYDEYNQSMAEKYVADIHAHFDRFKGDTLIRLANNVREESGVSFDAVMSMAVNLMLTGEKFSFQENWEKNLDKRWTHKAALQFVTLLNQFYTKTKARVFFATEVPYYNKITKAFEQTLSNFHLRWYYDYYSIKPKDKFNIIIGCGNGGANYGPHITDKKGVTQVFAIMGSWSFDKEGNPEFKQENYLPTVIHEFNHSFINPLLNNFSNNIVFKNSMEKILDTLETEMKMQAYGDWETILNESLVRASVVRYLMKSNPDNTKISEGEIMEQVNRGFLWTRELVSLLGVYEMNRGKYPTINEFYPNIINFFKTTADSISLIKARYEINLPTIMSVGPFFNNAQNVDTSIKEMTVNFSDTMTGKGYSISYGPRGKDFYPVKSIIGYANNNKSIKIELALKPDTEYEMILTGRAFKNIKGYPLKNYILKFKTKK